LGKPPRLSSGAAVVGAPLGIATGVEAGGGVVGIEAPISVSAGVADGEAGSAGNETGAAVGMVGARAGAAGLIPGAGAIIWASSFRLLWILSAAGGVTASSLGLVRPMLEGSGEKDGTVAAGAGFTCSSGSAVGMVGARAGAGMTGVAAGIGGGVTESSGSAGSG